MRLDRVATAKEMDFFIDLLQNKVAILLGLKKYSINTWEVEEADYSKQFYFY